MSLRTRLTVAVVLLVSASIAAIGIVLHNTTEAELVGEVDAFLEDRARQLRPLDAFVRGARDEGIPQRPGGRFGLERFSQDDAVAQVVVGSTVVVLTDVELPVDDDSVSEARSGGEVIETVAVDGDDYRTLTTALGRSDAVLIVGRNLDEVNGALEDLARRTVVIGLVGAAVAALVAWAMASRLARPVRRLTDAAEHVARTQDLGASIEVTSGDEVGRLATSFNTMLAALDTSRRQQQRLVMDASHELRTPLTSMRTNVDVLRRASSISDAERGEVLDDVSRELDELSTLVAELVELSTSSQRPSEPVVEMDLGELVDEVAELTQRRHSRRIMVDASGSSTVMGQRSLVVRAITNLVDNAVKFSVDDSDIDVTVTGTRVAVRDRGRGIDAEDRPLVFDRFYRATSARSEPGSGLGLAIVADVVAAHHGNTFVEDAPQDGGGGVVVGFEIEGMAS